MILRDTLRLLQDEGQLVGRSIRSICLTQYFHVVELDDGSVGACMNYANLNRDTIPALEDHVARIVVDDPLLIDWLFGDKRPWRRVGLTESVGKALVTSLQATVLNAVSSRRLREGGDRWFVASEKCHPDPFTDARRVVVIGFGGYMKSLLRRESVGELHIADLRYPDPQGKMDAQINDFRQQHTDKRISISNGQDTAARLAQADAVSITGSALCNGTLENLLSSAGPGTRVVVQGQSAAIHPAALFQRGVDLVATTIKPARLVQLAREDVSGQAMRAVLEGGLPLVYCQPGNKTHPTGPT